MTDAQRLLIATELASVRKHPSTGVLLALILGGLGGHRFYLGQVWIGVLYVLFAVTLIPAFVALIEVFLMSGRVHRYNARLEADITARVLGQSTAEDARVDSAADIPHTH